MGQNDSREAGQADGVVASLDTIGRRYIIDGCWFDGHYQQNTRLPWLCCCCCCGREVCGLWIQIHCNSIANCESTVWKCTEILRRCVCLSVCECVCLSCSCSYFWKHWPRNFIFGTQSSQYLGQVRLSRSSGQGEGHMSKNEINDRN